MGAGMAGMGRLATVCLLTNFAGHRTCRFRRLLADSGPRGRDAARFELGALALGPRGKFREPSSLARVRRDIIVPAHRSCARARAERRPKPRPSAGQWAAAAKQAGPAMAGL